MYLQYLQSYLFLIDKTLNYKRIPSSTTEDVNNFSSKANFSCMIFNFKNIIQSRMFINRYKEKHFWCPVLHRVGIQIIPLQHVCVCMFFREIHSHIIETGRKIKLMTAIFTKHVKRNDLCLWISQFRFCVPVIFLSALVTKRITVRMQIDQ